jgi:lipopolysaccharide export system protein LptC
MTGRFITLLALLLAALLSGWWFYGADSPESQIPDTAVDDFDYFLSDFELAEMDQRGELKHTLIAENLYHYPDREQSTLAQPRMMFYEESRMAWKISAEQGIIQDEDRQVFLSGDVRINYMSQRPEQDFEIFTERLNVWQEEQRAETGDPVRIEQLSGTTSSTGMKAEFDVRRLDLLSEVRGHYEP